MPAIHQLAQAAQLAQAIPVRFLKRDGDDDDDGGDGMDDILSGGAIAAIVVVVLAVLALGACWCLCCRGRKRKGRNNDGKQDDGQSQEDKYKKKAIKKILKQIKKKIKKMLKKDKKKDKKDNKNEENAHLGAPPAYGQGTHPGYMEREMALGYNGGYNRLDEHDERVELSGTSTPKYSS